jgi:hypothetical protein
MTHLALSVPLSLLLAVSTVSVASTGREPAADWLTVAEASDFRATSSYQETVQFLRRVDAGSEFVRLEFFGRSGARKPLPLVIVSADRAFAPDAAAASGKPVLLIQSCIHAGEVDGKDATLMILRDLATGRLPAPRNAIVLFVPILNADGHERVSPHNRPNQDGPEEGMGFRVTANGLNLNRDHLRLESVEMRALIRLFNDWRPQLHVDNHVTNGSDHGWVLTWAVAEAPQLADGVHEWVQSHLASALEMTREQGHATGPYVYLRDSSDPLQGFTSLPLGPRYSTNYFPIRNTPSILVEMHAHKPFRNRVLANKAFLIALIDEVDGSGGSLVEAVDTARNLTTDQGRTDAEPSDIVLRWRSSEHHEIVLFPAADWYTQTSLVTGKPLLRYRRGSTREIEVPWYHTVEPELAVARPRGYLVLPGWPEIEGMLVAHGLECRILSEPISAEVETIRVADPEFRSSSYQGTVMVEAVHVSRQLEERTIPAGSLWIPASQPDFDIAAQLFEPEAPDSMLRWGLLSTVFERKEYIDARTLEDLALDMLVDDEVRAAWEEALEDEAFAADPRERHLWWYRRTPSWDEDLGLLPVFRVMSVPQMRTVPWEPPHPDGR